MWLALAVAGYSLLAVVAMLDKFVVTNERVKPLRFVFFSTVIALPILLFIPFVAPLSSPFLWFVAFGGGLSYALALGTMYQGFSESEVSHIGPLVGAAVPFFTIFISWALLPEQLSFGQLLAIGFLIIGSLLIAIQKGNKHLGWHRGAGWAVISGFCFALFYITAKYLYDTAGFSSGFVWLWGAMALVGSLLILAPSVRAHFHERTKKQRKKTARDTVIILSDKILALVAVGLIQVAIAQGPVTLVNALAGLQYGVLVILVAAISRFFPRFFKERYTAGEVAQEGTAVLLIATGVALLVVA